MSQAARDAGYKCKKDQTFGEIGAQNFKKLNKEINEWLDNVALSDEAIKKKIAQGFKAKETKFFSDKGKITDEVEVEALETQRRYVDMAAKVKGLYAPEKIDVTTETYEDRLRRITGDEGQ